jgi:DNA-binding transcriptional LysR family regulator
MMMDLNQLRHFALVVQHGGFSAAEREAHIPKAKLSRHVMELEERVGVRLLQRSTRRLALTEAGRLFYEHCSAMIEEASAGLEALEQLRSEPVGIVRVSCPNMMAHIHAQTIADFMRLYPKVRIELLCTDRIPDLIEDRIDIALHVRGFETNPDLVTRRIRASRFMLVASPRYLASHPVPEHPADLIEHDTIGELAQGREQTWELVASDGRTAKVSVQPRLLISDHMVQQLAAVGGAGVALLPLRAVWGALADGTLQRVAKEWATPEFDIHVAYLSRRGMLPAVRTLVDFLVERIALTVEDFLRRAG